MWKPKVERNRFIVSIDLWAEKRNWWSLTGQNPSFVFLFKTSMRYNEDHIPSEYYFRLCWAISFIIRAAVILSLHLFRREEFNGPNMIFYINHGHYILKSCITIQVWVKSFKNGQPKKKLPLQWLDDEIRLHRDDSFREESDNAIFEATIILITGCNTTATTFLFFLYLHLWTKHDIFSYIHFLLKGYHLFLYFVST